MNQPSPASISSRRAVWLCWLLLFVAVVFGPSQARASFTKPAFQTPEVIALSFAPQVPSEPRFKLEIGTGILCGNDPVNRHDPLGLDWKDWALINGGSFPIGDPFYDAATGQAMVTMRKVVALTLGGRMNTTSDSVMSLAAGRRLAPGHAFWSKPLPPRPTLLAGTGFQGVDFGDIANYIENHPGWNAQLGVMEGGLYGLGGGYLFGGVRAILGARLTGYAGSGLLGMGLGEWASNDFAVNPRTAGQMLGGLPTGGAFFGAGERHGAAGMRALANAFAPQEFSLSGGMMRSLRFSEAGSVINPFAELFGSVTGKLDLYPRVIDPRTGTNILFPSGVRGLAPKADRVSWGSTERGEYIAEWYRRGFATPRGGWDHYDIHHIQPREYGGGNAFWNLVPVERGTHQELFNAFWRDFVW